MLDFSRAELIKPAPKILPFIRLPFVEIVKQIYKKKRNVNGAKKLKFFENFLGLGRIDLKFIAPFLGIK